MLTRLLIRNFKRFREADIELGGTVVLVGPNDSGKTSALQALALWDLGVRRWVEKRGSEVPEKRPGVTINRRDLVALPVPDTTLLWRGAKAFTGGRKQQAQVLIEVIVEGVTEGRTWRCALEFYYANEESLRCRPGSAEGGEGRMPIPDEARRVQLAYLPPMSGLTANEALIQPGAIAVRIGEGRTAEVLRNLCHQALGRGEERWRAIVSRIEALFGVELEAPRYIAERGEIEMSYRDQSGTRLDLSSSGRGLQQTLLLLTYLDANPGAVLLLDEPDAHLEILRQRQIYDVLTDTAGRQGSQIIAASHSEVILNEAADRDVVVAFVGKPHRIDDRAGHGGRRAQVTKALKEIGFDDYYRAERMGWVLYLEGSTDLAILRSFARVLGHPVGAILEPCFVHYVGNSASAARRHFFGLREAKPDLVGCLVLDRDDKANEPSVGLEEVRWRRREIENYLCRPEVLRGYAAESATQGEVGPLFSRAEAQRRIEVMDSVVAAETPPAALSDPEHTHWRNVKASDEYLDRIFEQYFVRLGLPNLMRKSDYHQLVPFIPAALVDPEVAEKLDVIAKVAAQARPLTEE